LIYISFVVFFLASLSCSLFYHYFAVNGLAFNTIHLNLDDKTDTE
jgi:hypothetical protein